MVCPPERKQHRCPIIPPADIDDDPEVRAFGERLDRIRIRETKMFNRFVSQSPNTSGPTYRTAPSFAVVQQCTPPVKGGITDILESVFDIVHRPCLHNSEQPTLEELRTLPTLLRRCQHLLDVYYTYQVFGQKSNDLAFCDIDDPAEISARLATIGESLKLDSCVKLMRLFKNVPGFADLIFEGLKPNAHCHAIIDKYQRGRELARPKMQDRRGILRRFQLLEGYRAHHQWNYFCGPIWEACVNGDSCFDQVIRQKLNDDSDTTSLPLRLKALQSFLSKGFTSGTAILNGTSVWEYLILYLKYSPMTITHFAYFGGLPCLVSGALLFSIDAPEFFDELFPMILKLSDDGVILGLDVSKERDVRNHIPFLLVNILNHIFDLEALNDARLPSQNISQKKLQLIALLVRALAKEEDRGALLMMVNRTWFSAAPSIIWQKLPGGDTPSTSKDFEAIFRKAIKSSQGSRIRHLITLYDAGVDPVSEARNFGCCNVYCPDRVKLFELAEEGKGIDFELLPEGQEGTMRDKWGRGMKLCGGCKGVAYCSRECQRQDWKENHRDVCGKAVQGDRFHNSRDSDELVKTRG